MRELSLIELREKQLEILDDIHKYCIENDLKYSLAGGTLLGAIRHKGYIPWDDDIDIMMPRDDYEYLMENFNCNEKYNCHHLKGDGKNYFPRFYGKISLNNTKIIEPNSPSFFDNIGINVDVFPIDHLSKRILSKGIKLKLINFIKRVYLYSDYLTYQKNKLKYPLSFIKEMSLLLMSLIVSNKYNSQYAVSIGSFYLKKDLFDKSLYENYKNISFENRSYLAIKDYDKYLSQIYGDYMIIPKETERYSHNFKAYEYL
ncbi:phosphorylcholine transferase LicD [Photobacterium sp. GB-210]|uniref:LicD family protein n=1 Tax=Photobacterium sp. GB-210 TaxID=2022104 RepID=UPI000D15E403|nr:LicD family protein [Photobacterium sp. GB-210]PSV39779.1 LicD family protein [Photobacterium sp. GB-210]